MSSTPMKNPSFRVYVAFDASASSGAAESLRAIALKLGPGEVPPVAHRLRESEGSKFHPPFVALEIGFEIGGYDVEAFREAMLALFDDLDRHLKTLQGISIKDVERRLVVNINSKCSEERPVFTLTAKQLATLALLEASLDVDSYLMF